MLKPSRWLYITQFHRELYARLAKRKELLWHMIKKSALILVEITIRKSQNFTKEKHPTPKHAIYPRENR
jgi:hypothetical protein